MPTFFEENVKNEETALPKSQAIMTKMESGLKQSVPRSVAMKK